MDLRNIWYGREGGRKGRKSGLEEVVSGVRLKERHGGVAGPVLGGFEGQGLKKWGELGAKGFLGEV